MLPDEAIAEERMTFSQRHGYEPLPKPMELEVLSDDLRRETWNLVREHIVAPLDFDRHGPWYPEGRAFAEEVLGRYFRVPEDEIVYTHSDVSECFKNAIMSDAFHKVLDLLELVLGYYREDQIFREGLQDLFANHSAAYWLDVSGRPYRFVPQASAEQGTAIREALETLEDSEMEGAQTHFRQAIDHINNREFAEAVTDSIHAVESVARLIDPEASKTLGKALDSLERAGKLQHGALKGAFEKLYGYTNSEEGMRHPLLKRDSPNVGLEEAVFMFGACACFASYLVQKHRLPS